MKILVGISGGVDSAYAAKKLLSQGHEVEGAILIMHEHTEIEAAREVAKSVGIPLYEIDCTTAFCAIKKNFVNEYVSGRTPNPCIICNEKVKFALLYDHAVKHGFDAIATGHYARIDKIQNNGETRYAFAIPEDSRKEQTYMLYRLPQEIISHLALPLSEGTKAQIRLEAEELGISAANRKDSQEICFLPEGHHAEYIESVAGKCPNGNFVDSNGRVLGRHKGIIHYTVGQRKGLGISLGERTFVTDINAQTGDITLASAFEGEMEILVTDMVYSGMKKPETEQTVTLEVKLRYSAQLVKTDARLFPDGTAVLSFEAPQKCAPGQSAVLYKNGTVLCGGFIVKK